MKGLKLADLAFVALTAAGGGGITPASFPGLQGWWKADSLVLSDNDPVSSWPDESGNGRTMLQATGASQPLFKAAVYNGLPTVRYDGIDDFMALAAMHALATDLTMMAVAKTTLDNSLLFGRTNASSQARMRRAGVDEMNFFPGASEQISGGIWPQPIGDLKRLAWKRSTQIDFFQSESAVSTTPSSLGNFNFEVLGAGAASTIPFGGDICEACYWNVALSNADILAIYPYFQARWGLP